jgi:hypothetical protein
VNDSHVRVEELVKIVSNHLGTDEPGPDTDDLEVIANYWVQRYFESKGYTYYSRVQSAKPVKTKLAERGWFLKWRVPSMVDPNRRAPRPEYDPLEDDLIARVIRRVYIDKTLVKTPQELIEEGRTEKRREELDLADPPANPWELNEHLVKIAPALQTRHLFLDEEKLEWEIQGVYTPIHTAGYIRTEYWESAKTGEGLWVFTAYRVRRRESGRRIPSCVWWKVKGLEKLAEYVDEPLNRAPQGDEDQEVRQAVDALYWEGDIASFAEWVENQP